MKRYFDSYAVIGLGFGDEGKGVSVNSLAKYLQNPLVVRYSGGQQAGHTVTLPDGTSHVFSNFGAGSLLGAHTFWSKYCTFDPVGVVNERNVLLKKGIEPVLYVDFNSPITTPYDKESNHKQNQKDNHGTCGVGVGATFNREEKFYSLVFSDLFHPTVFKIKLEMIKKFYNSDADISYFLECCEQVKSNPNISGRNGLPTEIGNDIIFEGSQGLLLDQNVGFFPHVTRSNVDLTNPYKMGFSPLPILVTRAFQTRHGNGPMTNSNLTHNIKDNPLETNILNKYQGEFRKALLDLDLLRYGIEKSGLLSIRHAELVITCLDLVKDEYRYTLNGQIVSHSNEDSFVKGIAEALHIPLENVHRISGPDQTFIPHYKINKHLMYNPAVKTL